MLAIQTAPSSKTIADLTPNILPCKIHHNGPIPTPKRYWNPTTSTDPQNTTASSDQEPTQTAYLRGRKLLGHSITLPLGYQGVVLQKTQNALFQPRTEEEDGEDEEERVEVKITEQTGKFSEVVVWGHEVVPDEEDAYRKGIEEWMGFAETVSCTQAWEEGSETDEDIQMHSYDAPLDSKT